MKTIDVRITDESGALVRFFSTNDPGFADEHIRMWQERLAGIGQKANVTRTETGQD